MMKKIVFSFLFFITLSVFSQQKSINDYKYVIVPDKFDFLKTSDQYQTSSLTKFLLEKKGFTVFLSNDTSLPKEVLQNRCMALTAIVVDASSLFSVKNKIELKDCFDEVIYSSKEGRSKEKDYKKSYHQAIRNAYDSMSDLKYSYKPKNKVVNSEEIVPEIISPLKKVISTKNTPVLKKVAEKSTPSSSETIKSVETLYAQAKKNGFQLVNTTPTIIFQILKTNVKDVFIIKSKNGILYKNKNIWIAEYYEKNKLVIDKYDIKF